MGGLTSGLNTEKSRSPDEDTEARPCGYYSTLKLRLLGVGGYKQICVGYILSEEISQP